MTTSQAKSTTSKSQVKSKKKAPGRKKTGAASDKLVLATCPVNGAGWCPYPFSIAQLKKRLKAKQLEKEQALLAEAATATATGSKSRAKKSAV
ncbi:MAG: hypothetical protein SFV17_19145 [Candidatus Obscuribacter sp.]|nr:hypothetical protein [Candidatus Melainabacteria bacterium]MDX1988810.1 hypothetical protein [Candidatus Obscuribacter sp.]